MPLKLIILITFSCLIVSQALYSQEASKHVTADSLFVTADYISAYEEYNRLVLSGDTALHTLSHAGLSAHKIGRLTHAKDYFIQIDTLYEAPKSILSALAGIYEQENNTPKAIKYYTKLVNQFPDDPIYYRKLGRQYFGAKLYKYARTYYNEALNLNSFDQYALKGLAEIYIVEDKHLEADSLLWKGLSQDSTNYHYALLIANSKYRQKAYDSTAYYMEKVIGRVDFRAHESKILGYAYLQIDSLEKAVFHLTRALDDSSTKEYAHYHLAVAFEKLEQKESAIHHFQKALEEGISSNVDIYHRNLGRIHSKNNNNKEAIPHYQDAYKYGEDPLILFYLARASDQYYKDKNIAVRYYQKYINSNDNNDSYKAYSKERLRLLKEQLHFNKN